jgi:hypothetical protein
MIPENEILFVCTRKDFGVKHQEQVINLCNEVAIDWKILYLTALHHRVAPLIYYNLSKCGDLTTKIDQETIKNFKFHIINNHLCKSEQEKKISETLLHFHKENVKIMLVKGAALNFTIYKDFPWHVIGDIDLILNIKREDITDQKYQAYGDFFWRSIKSELTIEWELFDHHDISLGKGLPINFDQIFGRAIETKFKEQKVLIMCPEDMLLTACIGAYRKRFFRLKSLLDITNIINDHQKLNWDQLVFNAKEYDCSEMVYASLLATTSILKCEIPHNVLNALKINPFRRVLIDKIIDYCPKNLPLLALLSDQCLNIGKSKINVSRILGVITFRHFPYISKKILQKISVNRLFAH